MELYLPRWNQRGTARHTVQRIVSQHRSPHEHKNEIGSKEKIGEKCHITSDNLRFWGVEYRDGRRINPRDIWNVGMRKLTKINLDKEIRYKLRNTGIGAEKLDKNGERHKGRLLKWIERQTKYLWWNGNGEERILELENHAKWCTKQSDWNNLKQLTGLNCKVEWRSWISTPLQRQNTGK